MNYLKQTQTKPILLGLMTGKIALSGVEGPVSKAKPPMVVFSIGGFSKLFCAFLPLQALGRGSRLRLTIR